MFYWSRAGEYNDILFYAVRYQPIKELGSTRNQSYNMSFRNQVLSFF